MGKRKRLRKNSKTRKRRHQITRRAKLQREQLRAEALEWAMTRGSRSGRVAWQYIQDLARARAGAGVTPNPGDRFSDRHPGKRS